jgi:four helix bundle protein
MGYRFEAYEVALELVAALRPVLVQLGRRDRDLADQMRRAAASVVLNLAEGARRTGRDRLHFYRIAAGSAAEVRAALAVARAWPKSKSCWIAFWRCCGGPRRGGGRGRPRFRNRGRPASPVRHRTGG